MVIKDKFDAWLYRLETLLDIDSKSQSCIVFIQKQKTSRMTIFWMKKLIEK